MHVHLALFDPASPAKDGSSWNWRSLKLDRNLLDRTYYDYAAAHRPQDLSRLSASSIAGGGVHIDGEWVLLYRFAHGGRDAHGRSGRWVLVVMAMKVAETRGQDISQVLACREVMEIISQVPSAAPIPLPPSLVIEVACDHVQPDPGLITRGLEDGQFEEHGEGAIRAVLAACNSLPPTREWSCSFSQTPSGTVARATWPPPASIPESTSPPFVHPATSVESVRLDASDRPTLQAPIKVSRMARICVAAGLLAIALFWGSWNWSSRGNASGISGLAVQIWDLDTTSLAPHDISIEMQSVSTAPLCVIAGGTAESTQAILDAYSGRFDSQRIERDGKWLMVFFDADRIAVSAVDRIPALSAWWNDSNGPAIVLLDRATGARIEVHALQVVVHREAADSSKTDARLNVDQ